MFKRLITLGAKFIKMVKPAVNEAKEKLPEVVKKTETKVDTYQAPKVAEIGKTTTMKRPDGCTVETTIYPNSPVRRRQTVYDKNGNIISENATHVDKSNVMVKSTFERRDYTPPLAVGENKGAETHLVLIERNYSPTSPAVEVWSKSTDRVGARCRTINFESSLKRPTVEKRDYNGHAFNYLPLSY